MPVLRKMLSAWRTLNRLDEIVRRLDNLQMAAGRVEARQIAHAPAPPGGALAGYEFKVYSQFGEDGIIQHLIHAVEIPRRIFVEFGVEDYRESNTRFLLRHDNWSGLVLDGSARNIDRIKGDPLYWAHDLTAVCAFIDRDNIDGLLTGNGIAGDIGLLSIDIDGNDYWVWEAITSISPRIVVCEYDSLLGPDRAIVTPYDPAFVRSRAHYSQLYGGASVAALAALGSRKGYFLAGSNSAGNNLFFVRNDCRGALKSCTPQEAWVQAAFRNGRDRTGRFTYAGFGENREVIGGCPVVDLERNETVTLREALSRSPRRG